MKYIPVQNCPLYRILKNENIVSAFETKANKRIEEGEPSSKIHMYKLYGQFL